MIKTYHHGRKGYPRRPIPGEFYGPERIVEVRNLIDHVQIGDFPPIASDGQMISFGRDLCIDSGSWWRRARYRTVVVGYCYSVSPPKHVNCRCIPVLLTGEEIQQCPAAE